MPVDSCSFVSNLPLLHISPLGASQSTTYPPLSFCCLGRTKGPRVHKSAMCCTIADLFQFLGAPSGVVSPHSLRSGAGIAPRLHPGVIIIAGNRLQCEVMRFSLVSQPLGLRVNFMGSRDVAQRFCIQWLPAASSVEPSFNLIDLWHRPFSRHTRASLFGSLYSSIGTYRRSYSFFSLSTDLWIRRAVSSICTM